MSRRTRTLAVLALSLAPTLAVPAALEGAALEASLQGGWCNSDDGGKTCWGYDNFASGKVSSCGTFPKTRTNFTGQSIYTINGTKVCHVIAASSIPDILKPGERFCVEVLQIDNRTQRFRDLDTGHEAVVYRMQAKDIRCPGSI